MEIETEDVRIPYRETITAEAEAEGKYKKQTGGHGQFGVASIRIEPLGRGEGFRFIDQVVGGAIPRQYIPAVEKGIVESMGNGGVHGYPVVDVQVACFDGKRHPVDSSEMSFKMAGSLAFKEAMAKAVPVLLEPVSLLEVTVPASMQGHVLGDLNSPAGGCRARTRWTAACRRSSPSFPPPRSSAMRSISAPIPGDGERFRAEHDHYDVMPANLVDRMVKTKGG